MKDNQAIRKTLAENLKRLRRGHGRMTQDELAEIAGVSKGYVADVERGATWPSPEYIDSFADAFGIYPHELYKGEEISLAMVPREVRIAMIQEMNTSHILQYVADKIAFVPEGIFILAQNFSPGHRVWKEVEACLEGHLKPLPVLGSAEQAHPLQELKKIR